MKFTDIPGKEQDVVDSNPHNLDIDSEKLRKIVNDVINTYGRQMSPFEWKVFSVMISDFGVVRQILDLQIDLARRVKK